jgi:outer membrane protein TolC
VDTCRKRSTRCRLFGALLLGGGLSVLQGAIPAQIRFAEEYFPGLQELLMTAPQSAPDLAAHGLRIEEREGDAEVVRAQRRPQAWLRGRVIGSYEQRDDIGDDFRGDLNANLTVTQPLYHWGQLRRRVDIAEQRVELEGTHQEMGWQRHLMELRRTYLDWLLLLEREEILRPSLELAGNLVDVYRQLVEAGQAAEHDLLEMEARLLETRESLAFVEKGIAAAKGKLRRLTGTEIEFATLARRDLEVIEPMSAVAFEDFARACREAADLHPTPELERLQILGEIEDEQLAVLNKQNWPKLDFIAGIFSDRLDAVGQADSVVRIQYFAGVQLNWNVFDSWLNDARKRSSLARKRLYEYQEEAARSEKEERLETLLAQVRLNLQQVEARSKRKGILERRVELLRQQAQRNIVTGTDRLEGEIDYLELSQRLLQARVDYLVNLMQIGVLLDAEPMKPSWQNEQ